MSKSSKLAQKEYKTWHNLLGKVIHWESWRKFKFDLTNEWYMQNPEFLLEIETHKPFWNFVIQTDHLISARRADLTILDKKKKKKKKNLPNIGLCSPCRLQSKIKRKRKER